MYSLWKVLLFISVLSLFYCGCLTLGDPPPDPEPADEQKTLESEDQGAITSVEIQGNQVIIQGDKKLTYTSVKHIVPSPGIVFYFPDTVLRNVKDITNTGSHVIQSILVRQQDINGPYSKIEMVLAQDTVYETQQNGSQLIVEFTASGPLLPQQQDSAKHAEPTETVTGDLVPIEPLASDSPEAQQVNTIAPEPSETFTTHKGPQAPESVFSIETTPFSRNALIQVHTTGSVENFKSSVIPDPPKIVFDLFDIQSPDRNMTFTVPDNPFVKGLRTFRYPKRLRVVIDTVPDYISSFQAYPVEEGLSIYIGLDLPNRDAQQMLDIPKSSIVESSIDSPVASQDSHLSPDNQSDAIPLQNEQSLSAIQTDASVHHMETDAMTVSPEPDFQTIFTPKPQVATTPVPEESLPDKPQQNTQQPANLQTDIPAKSQAVTAIPETPLPSEIPSESQVVTAMPETPLPADMSIQSQSAISMPQTPLSGLSPGLSPHLAQQYQAFSFIQPSTMMDSYLQKGQQQKYTGEKIAIDFYETDIKNVFRILREVSGQNFAIDSDVSGKVTLTLKKPVPWDQILDLILKMNQLGITYENDIIRVSRMATIQKAQQERISKIESEYKAAKKRQELLEPIITHYIAVNYARAKELIKHLEKISTKERGSISVDDRTNTIIITDVKEKIQRALSVVQNLDKPNLQVMIETRIIEVTTNFSRDIGVNWSGTVGIQPGDASSGIGPQRGYDVLGGTYGYNWAVNYPAAANSNIGINFRRLSGLTPLTLDAQLSAMESKGEIRILTSPRIVALDNKEASIEQGLEYPINTLDDKGNTITEFKDVDLDLKVTPHITQDGRVSMLIETCKNDLGPVVNGKQSFQKKQARTELLVNDGDTVVIGGIMKTVRNTSRSGVPLMSRLPMVGWLFSTHRKADDKEELIIFITPKIIKLENKALVKKLD